MTDWEFHAGEQKTAKITMTNPKGFPTYYDGLLYMGTDLAVMSQQSFQLEGLEEKVVPFPVTMPMVTGLYPVHLGIFTSGQLLELYQADDVMIKEPLYASKDAFIINTYPYYQMGGQNYSSVYTWRSNVSGELSVDRALLEFDVTNLESPVQKAILALYVTSAATHREPIWVCRLTRTDWVETEASWMEYRAGYNWSSGGGDYTTAGRVIVTPPSTQNWMECDITAIVNHAITNNISAALLLRHANESPSIGTPAYFTRLASREHATVGIRPRLIITE